MVLLRLTSAQRNFSAVRSMINDIKPSSFHRTIEDGLRFSARLFASSKNFNKEVYIISDFQSGSLESKLNMSKTTEQLFAPITQFFLIPLGKRELQNIAVESIDIPNTIFEVHKPFVAKVKLTNHGTTDVQNHVVSVYQDGSRVAQKGVDVHSGQSVETEFTLMPKHSGFLQGMIELEDDDLEFDNRRFFTVHIPEELRVLLVGNASDLTYLRLALATRLSDSSASLKMSETTWNRFSSSQLNNIDAVVLSNLHELSEIQSSALKTYLQNGGGALIFPGTQSTVTAFNTSITAILGISTIATIESQSRTPQSINSFIEFDKVDLRHPLFVGMFEKDEVKQSVGVTHHERVLESPRIHTSLRFLPTAHSKNIITLTNGSPFLIEEQIKNGRVLIVSVAANTEWSDLPLKGLFVPLIHRAISYLAQEPTMERSLLIGEERTVRLRSFIPPKLAITKPGGMEVTVNTQQVGANRSMRFSGTDRAGLYAITAGNLILDRFAVNVDPDESNTAPLDTKRREKMFQRLGVVNNTVHTVNQPQEVQRIVTESRLGAELWKQFLIAALIVAIVEMLVAQDTKRSLTSITTHSDE